MKLAGLSYTPRATTPSRMPPTSPARPHQKKKAPKGIERRREATAEPPVPASRQRHKDNDVTATSGVRQSPTMASQQRREAKYVTTTKGVMPSPGTASQQRDDSEDVTTTRDVPTLSSTVSHQRHDDKDVTSGGGMRSSDMALQQRHEGENVTTTRDVMQSPTMASQQRHEDKVDTTARDVKPSPTIASQQQHEDKYVTSTRDTSRPLVPSQPYPQRELPMPARSTHVKFTIQKNPGPGSEPVVVKSEIVPARQPETLSPQLTGSATPPQGGDTVEDDVDSGKDVGDQQEPADSPMLDDPESGGVSELVSASTDTAPDDMVTVSRDIAADDDVDVLGTVGGTGDSAHEIDYASMPDLEPIQSCDDSASDTESVDIENDGLVRCETSTTNVHSSGPTRLGFDESTPASLNRRRQKTRGGTVSTGVGTLVDSPKAWSGDSDSSSTSGGIAGGRPTGGATETEAEVMPCYPDESTRRDMLQSLLDKNDPRLVPTLQKFMAPAVDVGDSIVDALLSSALSRLYLDEEDEHGHVGGRVIFEGHDDPGKHDDSETHDDPEKHDDLVGLNDHEELEGVGRHDDHKERDDHERQDDRVEHDDHEGQDDHEGHHDPAESYGDPEREVDTAINVTYDDNIPEPEVRNECTICGESKDQEWFTDETGPVCVRCHAEKLRASLDETKARLKVSYTPKSPEVSDDSSDSDDDVPGTRTLKQPVGGTMSKLVDEKTDLPGYQQLGTITVTYDFPAGIIAVGA